MCTNVSAAAAAAAAGRLLMVILGWLATCWWSGWWEQPYTRWACLNLLKQTTYTLLYKQAQSSCVSAAATAEEIE
jgi:hypothetical protein